MIGRLTGRIVEEGADGTLVLDVNGVGYEVAVPLGATGRCKALSDKDGVITLYVHTHAREDALLLYGFATRDDRETFRILIGISNVGPKSAMAILSALTAIELSAVISRRETARLTAIPGIGKKTAERLILELKDKIVALPASPAPPLAAPASTGTKSALLYSALTGMGYRPSEADRAISSLGPLAETTPLNDLVRQALALLSR